MVTNKELRGVILLTLALLIALAWYFRYEPQDRGLVVWDRIGHRYCWPKTDEPMTCSR